MHKQDKQIQRCYKLIQQNIQVIGKKSIELKLHIPTKKRNLHSKSMHLSILMNFK